MKKQYSNAAQLLTMKTAMTICVLIVSLGTEKTAFSSSLPNTHKNGFLVEKRVVSHLHSDNKNNSLPTKEMAEARSTVEGKKLASRGGLEKNPASAFSQNSDKTSNLGKEDNAATQVGDTMIMERSKTNLDFSESLIEGKMKAPSGFYIQARKGQKLTNLIKLRASFRPEMLKSRGLMIEPSNQ
jgi:hypothetical protein